MSHAEILKEEMPRSADFIEEVFPALTQTLTPHMPILPMLAVMHEAWLDGDLGVLGEYGLVRMPLSIIPADGQRYRTPLLSILHETALSFNMSDITKYTLQKTLQIMGLDILMLCSCGVVFGSSHLVEDFYGSKLHTAMDRLRSAIDADGSDVITVDHHSQITVNMDMHPNGAEARMFDRMWSLINLLAEKCPVYPTDYDQWRNETLNQFIARVNRVNVPVMA